ncbi:MAG TPA: 3-hydroxyacyl-ACP dehydratase FabZ [Chloroflexia bacterium]|nr:3-hydroxyacyl-ACP dehydratase FabZ [Chloroflexia bacterium]
MPDETTVLSNVEIQQILPHRFPFLLVDKMIALAPGQSGVGIKGVTFNEWFFPGHVPGYPLMPGVLMVEALAQVAGIVVLSLPENHGKMGFFAGIDKIRFKRQVKPGDTLRLEVTITRLRLPICQASVQATVEGEVACAGEIMFMVGATEGLGSPGAA